MRLSAVRWAVGVAAATLLVAFGATAFACTNLATVILSSGVGHSGNSIAFTGASFASPRAGSGQPATPVVLHWESDTGPVLAQGTPDRAGLISGYFTVPQATPGIYAIFATQLTPRVPAGGPPDAPPVLVAEVGTPARSAFEVLPAGVNVSDVRPPVSGQLTEASGDLDSTVWIVLTAAFGAVALSLFGGGLIAFVHQTRQSKLPAEARWVPPGWYS
ncbi:MAG TPA: hypothetical protein VHT97_11040 [Acidimicrobiales bacterium]|jgi:hypothetical protein|nr:hypothetical protein [Acidimicrobiales bacterium]